ncbi:heavy metal translocating P-type ATPase [Gulosibacter bifidus]|uniref:Heavy metal translocating P-type ATPase n=1 Tax=Gulosibacter bifidus TaxID=272239 RepID=A0ABW5RK04_9MICO|nr:heavy metal translocating P-type ATPase [Gulosibacter bifidus]
MTDASTNPTADEVVLDLEGMTCASCANRIERKLNKLPGVDAAVNYALAQAVVRPKQAGAASGADVGTPSLPDAQQLVETVRAAGYDAQVHEVGAVDDGADAEAHAARTLLVRLVVCAVLTAPVIVTAMIPSTQFAGWQWVSMALTLPVVTWGAWPFHRAAWRGLRHGSTSMDTLVSLGITAAMLWSLVAMFVGHAGHIGMTHTFEWRPTPQSGLGNIYFEVAAGVTTFLLLGRFLEARAKRRAGSALRELLALGARDVEVIVAESPRETQRIPIDRLRHGHRFVVRPGERIATDGIVREGHSAIDAAVLTGESVPVDVAEGDDVIGATVNTHGMLVVEATRIGRETQLAKMGEMVAQAQAGKAAAQRLADRVSSVFVPIVLALSVVTLVAWLLIGATGDMAITAAVAVLIIACPCALGLAVPTAILAGTGRGSTMGILLSGPEALERARSITTVVLDKTGTVTSGEMHVRQVIAVADASENELLTLAAAVEQGSEHPIARAIVHAARERRLDLAQPEGFQNLPGHGARASVSGHEIRVGRDAAADGLAAELTARLAQQGETPVLVWRDDALLGAISVADQVAPDSAEAISQMRALGLQPVLCTGDHELVAQAVAAEVGVDRVIAGVLPEQKAEVVRQLQADGNRVAMVGDGVNDAPALATADLGIAMGGGTDAAAAASDITLVRGGLRTAVDAIRLSRAVNRILRQNLFWAFAYNVLALPLAAFGLLSPMIAGIAMAFSSVLVVTNSLRLVRFK